MNWVKSENYKGAKKDRNVCPGISYLTPGFSDFQISNLISNFGRKSGKNSTIRGKIGEIFEKKLGTGLIFAQFSYGSCGNSGFEGNKPWEIEI